MISLERSLAGTVSRKRSDVGAAEELHAHPIPIQRFPFGDLTTVSANNLVVTYRQITVDEIAVVLWIENCLINIVAGERVDAVARIP
jgi:hypothetical protein